MPLIIDTLKRKSNVLYDFETILKSLQLINLYSNVDIIHYIYIYI